ncbi:MAG: IS30 family transposase [Ruminococcaceae bacterium]|nr:IS30 family transposase [Oscillospiraceae bacterium]
MGKHLTLNDRKFIEKMLKQKIPVAVIADTLGVHRSTIYREIKKGSCEIVEAVHGSYKNISVYDCYNAQSIYDKNRKRCIRPLKLRGKYMHEIEKLLFNKYSPEMAVNACIYRNIVCTKTIYNYIDKCLFNKYRNIDLLHGKQKKHYCKDRRNKRINAINNSIENRPDDIMYRDTFGHWEMDTVIGKKAGTNNCLLVLTERKTRCEFVYKLEDKTSKSVVNQLRAIQRFYGKNYSKIFKTITVDNGTEFADIQGMKRFSSTQFYYCHPYSSWERGTNENRNKMIRRFIPKGSDIKKYSTDYIKSVENFINNYPMRIHNYQKPIDLFNAELKKIVQIA